MTQTTEHWTAETYRLLDAGDPRAWANFAPDIRVQIGNDPVAEGMEAAGHAFRPLSEAVTAMKHEVRSLHDLEPDRAALECDVTYTRLDGRVVTVPVVTLVRRNAAGQFSELLLYTDLSPVFQGQEAHIELEGTVEVSAEGGVTEDGLWAALVDKARNATKYVPNITECLVVDSGPGWILRDIVLDGFPTQERVTFEPKRRILFTRTRSNMLGTVENFLDRRPDGGFVLRFRFDLRCIGLAEGSSLATEIRDGMREGYLRTFHEVADNLRRGATTNYS